MVYNLRRCCRQSQSGSRQTSHGGDGDVARCRVVSIENARQIRNRDSTYAKYSTPYPDVNLTSQLFGTSSKGLQQQNAASRIASPLARETGVRHLVLGIKVAEALMFSVSRDKYKNHRTVVCLVLTVPG